MGIFSKKDIPVRKSASDVLVGVMERSLKNGYPNTTPESRHRAALELVELKSSVPEGSPMYNETRRRIMGRLEKEELDAVSTQPIPKFGEWSRS